MRTDNNLTKEYLRSLFDYRDGNLFWKVSRKGILKDRLAGAKSHHYYQICINYKIYRTHRLIWIYHYGNTDFLIDHINGNTFDNRIENLRVCNESESSCNVKKSKRNTSGVKGVDWSVQKMKWRARIIFKKKTFHVGFFKDIKEAEQKIKERRLLIHKEFCNHG